MKNLRFREGEKLLKVTQLIMLTRAGVFFLTTCVFSHYAMLVSSALTWEHLPGAREDLIFEDRLALWGFEKLPTEDWYCQIYAYFELLEISKGWY